MKRFLLFLYTIVFILGVYGTASATLIAFVPPNDPVGSVWSTNYNDGYKEGRGMVFEMLADVTINSLGIYQDLTDIDLSCEIAQTTTTSGNVKTGQTIIGSGNATVSTNGLEWIDFTFMPITLHAGNSYHFEFSHSGNGNQNFFYTQENYPDFTQGEFKLINGTCGGDTGNYAIPAFRVNALDAAPVPIPPTCLLFLSGIIGMAGIKRKFA